MMDVIQELMSRESLPDPKLRPRFATRIAIRAVHCSTGLPYAQGNGCASAAGPVLRR